MFKSLLPILLLVTASQLLLAGTKGKLSVVQDSIIRMHGYIYDTISQKPDTIPLKANLLLESLPFGSEIGIISSDDTSGHYEYFVSLKHQYKVNIKSDEHQSYFESLNPVKLNVNGEIRKDFYLQPEIKENQVIRLNKLIFEQGQSQITPESYDELNRLVALMQENPKMVIQLEGHTDYRGSKRLNMKLSEDRVESVKHYLTSQGIDASKIKTKAYGGTRPLIREKSIEASEINRRVEVRILKLK